MTEPLSKAQKRKRTSDFGISFESGYADGWEFGVPVAFRDALDIKRLEYVNREKTKERQKILGKTTNASQPIVVTEWRWTRGKPPALSFGVGDVFYRPKHVRSIAWAEALQLLTHTIQVKAAQADNDDGTGGGYVEFQLSCYENGKVVSHLVRRTSQAEFEMILKTGCL